MTAPHCLALARREHVVGDGAGDRGAAPMLPGPAGAGVDTWPALPAAGARGDREFVMTTPYRGA